MEVYAKPMLEQTMHNYLKKIHLFPNSESKSADPLVRRVITSETKGAGCLPPTLPFRPWGPTDSGGGRLKETRLYKILGGCRVERSMSATVRQYDITCIYNKYNIYIKYTIFTTAKYTSI